MASNIAVGLAKGLGGALKLDYEEQQRLAAEQREAQRERDRADRALSDSLFAYEAKKTIEQNLEKEEDRNLFLQNRSAYVTQQLMRQAKKQGLEGRAAQQYVNQAMSKIGPDDLKSMYDRTAQKQIDIENRRIKASGQRPNLVGAGTQRVPTSGTQAEEMAMGDVPQALRAPQQGQEDQQAAAPSPDFSVPEGGFGPAFNTLETTTKIQDNQIVVVSKNPDGTIAGQPKAYPISGFREVTNEKTDLDKGIHTYTSWENGEPTVHTSKIENLPEGTEKMNVVANRFNKELGAFVVLERNEATNEMTTSIVELPEGVEIPKDPGDLKTVSVTSEDPETGESRKTLYTYELDKEGKIILKDALNFVKGTSSSQASDVASEQQQRDTLSFILRVAKTDTQLAQDLSSMNSSEKQALSVTASNVFNVLRKQPEFKGVPAHTIQLEAVNRVIKDRIKNRERQALIDRIAAGKKELNN